MKETRINLQLIRELSNYDSYYAYQNSLDQLMSYTKLKKQSLWSKSEFAYLGEFYERHVEKGYALEDYDFVSMVLYFALSQDVVDKNRFNEYQIADFMKKIQEYDYDKQTNPFLDFALFMLYDTEKFEDVDNIKYLRNLITREDLNTEELAIFSYFLKIYASKSAAPKSSVIDMVKICIPYLEKLLKANIQTYSKSIGSLAYCILAIEAMELGVLKYCRSMSSELNKELAAKNWPLLTSLVKACSKKPTAKKDIETLTACGFDETHISGISFFLQGNAGTRSSLKIQRSLISYLKELAQKQTDFDELDKILIEEIFPFSEFEVKMEGGVVTSLKEAISYYSIFNDVKNGENWEYLYDAFRSHNKLDNNYWIRTVDFYEHSDFVKRLESLDSVSDILTLECLLYNLGKYCRPSTTSDTQIVEEKESVTVLKLISMYEAAMKKSIFNELTAWTRQGVALLSIMCDSGAYDIVHIVKNGLVPKQLYKGYVHDLRTKAKYLVMKLLYDNGNFEKEKSTNEENSLNGIITSFFSSSIFSQSVEDAKILTPELCNEMSCDELYEYLSILFECAMQISIKDFECAFLNVMIHNSKEVKKAFPATVVEEWYQTARKLLDVMEYDKYYGRFSKNDIIRLDNLYMSEETKARVIAEKKEQERLAKLEEARKLNEETQEIIDELANEFDFATTSDCHIYCVLDSRLNNEQKRTNAYKKAEKKLLDNMTIYPDELEKFLYKAYTKVRYDEDAAENVLKMVKSLHMIERPVKDVGEIA